MDLLTLSELAEDDVLELSNDWKVLHHSLRAAIQAPNIFNEWFEKPEIFGSYIKAPRSFNDDASAYLLGLQKVSELLLESSIDDVMLMRAVEMMKYLFTSRTIFASIAPDGGDLVFYWKAGHLSIEIDLLSDGGAWWSVDGFDAYEFTGHGLEMPLVELKHYLNIFSKEVDIINPSWRSLQTR